MLAKIDQEKEKTAELRLDKVRLHAEIESKENTAEHATDHLQFMVYGYQAGAPVQHVKGLLNNGLHTP
eukprot:662084-Karenia_brevis.AAC.1